jgi:hypothetical protein
MNYTYQVFGSPSSQDIDVMVFVDQLRSIDDNHTLIKELNAYFENNVSDACFDGRAINANLAVLKDGKVVEVFKGTEDECNNSLMDTYRFHHQAHPNHVTSRYDRFDEYYHIKLKRVARFIMSFFSREPELRAMIKPALRGDLKERLNALRCIDFTKYNTFPGKKEKHEDIYKVLAFQFAQVFGLANQQEIYTKEDAMIQFPVLRGMLMREPITELDIWHLNIYLQKFIIIALFEMSCMESLYE